MKINFKRCVSIILALCLILTLGCCGQKQETVKVVEPEVVEPEEEEIVLELNPHQTESSNPENFGIKWEIMANGEIVDSFKRNDNISFGMGYEFSKLEGVTTFRGNNYRNAPNYGLVDISKKELSVSWQNPTGAMGEWSGCGWTGQPLIVRWTDSMKNIMNINPEKKAKKDLVEVIYATLDGRIYFYDLEDGSETREPLSIGMTFKGTATIDPRGYPLMYIGSGIASGGKDQRMFIISLIDGKVLYEQSGSDTFSQRAWPAFDSSPMIDAETDTLIWPGENGVLYTLKLNSKFDIANATVEVNPEVVAKARYSSNSSRKGYWTGYECSSVIADKYLYTSENGGLFYCVDLDTMELLWAQDTLDDSNSTPVFEWDDEGNGYVYTAPSLHWTAQNRQGKISIYKLNANTGEIVWQVPYDCYTIPGTSGGIQASPVLGKSGTDIEGLIVYPVAFSPNRHDGTLVALDTKTGEKVWEQHMPNYTWSSPVGVYTPSGKGYIITCNSIGDINLINGKTGEIVSTVNVGSNVEASPAVFEDTLVVGTRGCQIYGIKIK